MMPLLAVKSFTIRLALFWSRGVVKSLCVVAVMAATPALVYATDFDLQTATIEDINKAFDAGALTSEKLTQLYLNRIAAYDQKGPKLNSIITLNKDALATARQLDAERKEKGPRSKLHGIPIVLKDLFDTKDMPTTAGFLPMKNSRPIQETLKEVVLELMAKYRLDALVYPFKSVPPEPHMDKGVEKDNPFSSIAGLPAVLVPAGYTKNENGPIAIEFLGKPFSEPTLFKLAYAYEQMSKNRKLPDSVPALPGERFSY